MPNFSLIPTQSLVSRESTAAGNGGPGDSEIASGVLSAVGHGAALYEQHQDEQARVWAGSAAADLHVRQLQATQVIRQNAVDAVEKNQPVPDMVGQFDDGFKQQSADLIQSAPSARAKLYLQGQLQSSRAALGSQVIGQQAQLERQWKLSTSDATVQSGAKIVQQDPTQFDAQMGNILATMPRTDPATDAARALRAKATLTSAAATSALDSNPYALRDATTKAMGVDPATNKPFSGPTGVAYVDAAAPAQVAEWRRAAENKIKIMENAQALDADTRERTAQTTFNGLQSFVAQGSVPDLDYTARVKADTAGTSFEASANAALDLASRGAGFGAASLPAQTARLEQMNIAAAQGTDPEHAALVTQLQQIHSAQVAAYKDDPIEAASRFAHAPAMPTTQIATVSQGLDLVGQRASTLPAIEAAAGAPVSPLHPIEAQQFGSLVRNLPPAQAASALSQLGGTLGTADRVAAVAKQFGDRDNTLGLAMAYAGNRSTSGHLVGELILRGDQALRDKTSESDKTQQTGWQATIANDLRGVYSSQDTENDAVRAAYLVAAGRSAMGSGTDLKVAEALVTGGVIQHGASGGKIPLPYGMTEDDFNQKLAAIKPSALITQVPDGVVHIGAATIPLDKFVASFPNATLVHAGQGLYNVRGGTQLATNSRGQRITIKVGP